MSGPNVNCASLSQSGLFSVSAGTYVDTTFTNYDPGDTLASQMGLSGTAEKVVASLIDLGLKLAGFNPGQSTDINFNYAITIGQNDYNIDKLAGVNWVGWTYYGDGPPPPVTFVQGQQIYGYPANNGGKPWLSSQNLNNKSTIAVFTGANASIGTTDCFSVKIPRPQLFKVYPAIPLHLLQTYAGRGLKRNKGRYTISSFLQKKALHYSHLNTQMLHLLKH